MRRPEAAPADSGARARELLARYREDGDVLWRRLEQAPSEVLAELRRAAAGAPPETERAIAALEALVAGLAPADRPDGLHVQAGGILLDRGRTLLRLTPSGHLVFPKGHVDPGETLRRTAEREVEEETGVVVRAEGYLGAFGFVLDGARYDVHMYALAPVALGPGFAAHEGRDAVLVPLDRAHAELSFDDYRRMLGRARALAGALAL